MQVRSLLKSVLGYMRGMAVVKGPEGTLTGLGVPEEGPAKCGWGLECPQYPSRR